MKYCKVEIQKDRTGAGTEFSYPEGFDGAKHNIIKFEDVGNATEHAVTIVPDTFDFGRVGYVELTQTEAEDLVGQYVQTDRNLSIPDLEEMPRAVPVSNASEPGNVSDKTKQAYRDWRAHEVKKQIAPQTLPVPNKKAEMKAELKRKRRAAARKPVTYNNNSFEADPGSQQKIQGAIQLAKQYNANNSDSWSAEWKLADNSFATVTQSDLEAVFGLIGEQVQAAYNREAQLLAQIEQATTIGELDAIDLTSGWP